MSNPYGVQVIDSGKYHAEREAKKKFLLDTYPRGTMIYYRNYLGCERMAKVTAHTFRYGKWQLLCTVEVPGHGATEKVINPDWVTRII